MSSTRIVFMGTPAFAVPSLDALVQNGYEVVAVVTAPDKPQGRGQKMGQSPVKLAALVHNIPVLQPTNLKDHSFLATLQSYHATLQVVVAFRMLPEVVWTMPEQGTFNLHASLLPAYRGAAPINWAIINGETTTGLTTFFLEQAIDTGHILFQEKESISAEDTAGTLYERLRHQGAQLVLKTVQSIESGHCRAFPQVTTPKSLLQKAPKIYKEDCQINWTQQQAAVINFVRGLSPYPAAWTVLREKTYKILEVKAAPISQSHLSPGEISSDGKHHVYVGTQDMPVAISILQPAGKQVMTIEEFLRGYRI